MKELSEVLVESLSKGIVKFVFIKSDNTERVAFGTTNPDLVPKYNQKDVANLIAISIVNYDITQAIAADNTSQFLQQLVDSGILHSDPKFQEIIDKPMDEEKEAQLFGIVQSKVESAIMPFLPKEATDARKKPENLITYYDLEKQGWRSCKTNSILKLL